MATLKQILDSAEVLAVEREGHEGAHAEATHQADLLGTTEEAIVVERGATARTQL
jgi:hypothetical protein